MKWPALVLAGFAASASVSPETDFPHRDWGQVATLNMTLNEATACVARTLDREGSVLVLPVDGGNDLDYSAGTVFGGSINKAWATFAIRGAQTSTLRISYRHPINQKWLRRVMRNMTKGCLHIGSIQPA